MILKNNPMVEPPFNISPVFNKSPASSSGDLLKGLGGVGGPPPPQPSTITYANRTLTLSQWSKEFNIPLATLRYRVLAGWTDLEILGLSQHPRDRTREQTPQASARANVLIVDQDGTVVARAVAAARLKIKPRSLAQRLRRWAVPGKQVRIGLADLFAGSRLEQFQTYIDKR